MLDHHGGLPNNGDMTLRPSFDVPSRRLSSAAWAQVLLLAAMAASAQEISNGLVSVRAVGREGRYLGFEVLARGSEAAVVRFSSARVQLSARKCEARLDRPTLVFSELQAAGGSGLELGTADTMRVTLRPGEAYPAVAFDLTIAGFDAGQWTNRVGLEPFHFLALYLAEAEAWHQRGWLNATPLADPFPLLLDRHAGTPEICGYLYNRHWSYTPPLGAHPLPVIGLWAPRSGRYVGFEFQTTRLEDNSEKEIATGYRWEEAPRTAGVEGGQFVALVYPFGGQGYQQLVWPAPGTRLKSRATLLWSRNLPASDDPNRLLWSFLWEHTRQALPSPPETPDVGWIPGGIRQGDFQGPPAGGLIGGVERPFQVDGSRVLSGWGWHNESPTAVPARRGDTQRLQALENEAQELLRLAKHFQAGGEDCVFWEKPLAGQWTEEWGGAPVTTLHNANGFAAGALSGLVPRPPPEGLFARGGRRFPLGPAHRLDAQRICRRALFALRHWRHAQRLVLPRILHGVQGRRRRQPPRAGPKRARSGPRLHLPLPDDVAFRQQPRRQPRFGVPLGTQQRA